MAVLTGIIGVVMFGCNQSSKNPNPASAVITSPGTYHLQSVDADLHISDQGNHILSFWVVTRNGIELLRSTEQPSTLQRWLLFWDNEKKRLWFSSSDIGTSVWDQGDKGTYQQIQVANSPEYIKRMPEVFFVALPTSLQRRWAAERAIGTPEK
jgi:hypothetical protein